jgi:phosphopantothenoylcysteine decarboxylase/phosphopantothenate--cysteine ligase
MSQRLSGKKILLGVTGGIAAYKSAQLCRELKKEGAIVRVVMTAGAQEFITPLTMQALSGNPVHTQLLDTQAEAGMGHIELAKWPDVIVIAPSTASFLARYAHGFADDLLGTLLLATVAPVILCPAMNQAMWLNPLTQRNLQILKDQFGSAIDVYGPDDGEQACGDVGPGRMLEAETIKDKIVFFFGANRGALIGKKVVITAGPTQEAIDPVRYISNHSSGKMGYALAQSCYDQGAEVVLISGPTNLPSPSNIKRKNIVSAKEMFDTVMTELDAGGDIFIACAAVADYRPTKVLDKKIKKKPNAGDEMTICMQQNPDIVASVANREKKPFTVGFAAETHDVLDYAKDKLARKKLDMIVANDVSNSEIGFSSEHNEVYVISKDKQLKLERQLKTDISDIIVSEVIKLYI